jgi:hypothetical protein
MATVDELREKAHDLYARARMSLAALLWRDGLEFATWGSSRDVPNKVAQKPAIGGLLALGKESSRPNFRRNSLSVLGIIPIFWRSEPEIGFDCTAWSTYQCTKSIKKCSFLLGDGQAVIEQRFPVSCRYLWES